MFPLKLVSFVFVQILEKFCLDEFDFGFSEEDFFLLVFFILSFSLNKSWV